MFQREQPRIVPVAPDDPNRVISHRLDGQHLQCRLEHLERVRRLGLARGGPVGAAAKLGVPRQTLESKIRKLGINRHLFKTS